MSFTTDSTSKIQTSYADYDCWYIYVKISVSQLNLIYSNDTQRNLISTNPSNLSSVTWTQVGD